MKIQVTNSDIKFGEQRSTCNCPIARAIRRQIKCRESQISVHNAIITPKGIAIAPPEARDFMNRFDLGWDVAPFKFDIEFTERTNR